MMSRARAVFHFYILGGLLIFLAPYLVYEAATKQIPSLVAIISIPGYAVISYIVFKAYWPLIFRKAEKPADKTTPSPPPDPLLNERIRSVDGISPSDNQKSQQAKSGGN
jgi:hypothetical protein